LEGEHGVAGAAERTAVHVKEIARLLDAKSAADIKVYDIRGVSTVADYFVISSANNRRHIRALCDVLLEYIDRSGIPMLGYEGLDEGSWALVDCADFVVHIFKTDAREFYDLELIWGDAPLVAWQTL